MGKSEVSIAFWALWLKLIKPKYYFDLKKALKSHAKDDTPYTSSVSLIVGLKTAIDAIKKERPNEIDLPYIGLKKISKIANWYDVKIPNNVIKNIILLHHPRCQLCFFPRMLTHNF